jgi:acid phosphatase family membrane protein YuiD
VETPLTNAPGLLSNITIGSALLAWTAAQFIKFIRHLRRTRTIDFGYFVSTGGMPSAHSAMVTALATSVGLREGLGGALFAVTLAFAIVVMFDAQSVRRAAGQQARLLNQIVQELFKEHHLSKQKLAEFLGHTRTEVFAGLLLGLCVAAAVHALAERL